jgi:hypothetical protein
LFDDRIDSLDDSTPITNIDLVELYREPRQFMELGRSEVSQFLIGVKNDDCSRPSLGTSTGNIIS